MPEPSKGKRRRGSQRERRADGYSRSTGRPGTPARPVTGGSVTSSIPGGPLLIVGAIVAAWSWPQGSSCCARGRRHGRGRNVQSGCLDGRRQWRLPDEPAAGAAGRPDPDRDAEHATGRNRDQGRGGPVAHRGRQLRGPGDVWLLRRDRLPPRRPEVRHPGRRPDRHGHRRTGLHDQGRAGDRHVQPGDGRHGPVERAGFRRLAVLHRPRRRGPLGARRPDVQQLPDHRGGHVRDGGGRRDRLGRRRGARTRPIRSRSRRRPSPTRSPAPKESRP